MSNIIEAWQCRAARGALGWSAEKLAEEAGISRKTLTDFEGEKRKMQVANADAVMKAFDRAGVYFDGSGCVCRR